MSLLRSPLVWILALVALQRLAELVLASANTRRLLARGGREVGRRHYPLFILLHGSWLVAIALTTPLGAKPIWPLVGVFVLLAGLCWLSVRLSKLMNPAQPAAADAAPAGGALIRALPYLTLVFAAFVPLAAGIYLVVSTGWALAERTFFWRTGRITVQPAPEPAPAQPVRSQSVWSQRGVRR